MRSLGCEVVCVSRKSDGGMLWCDDVHQPQGIDIGLKDGKGRTVLQALEGIPGEKLKDIQKLITG